MAPREIAEPAVGDHDVLVRVHAAGLDRGVWHVMAGLPYMVRITGFGLRAPTVGVRGMDVAGRVEAIGESVTRLRPGDEVLGSCDGSFAECTCAREGRLARRPSALSFEQAAAVPVSVLRLSRAVRRSTACVTSASFGSDSASGSSVRVAASGVQRAKAFGADVTGGCSTAKADLVRSIDADDVIERTGKDFADGRRIVWSA
jgi:NADPH:quinone reductase-like Zn-dependent oxidoreductase